MNRLAVIAMACAVLGGCDSDAERALRAQSARQPRMELQIDLTPPPTAQRTETLAAPKPPPDRFTVSRVQMVRDPAAYSGERGVYVIRDNQTGAEYVGLSGVGITELGRVNCGKACTREVER